jgi:hypothetical protein
MNRGQRLWFAISLVVVALLLATFFLEFAIYTTAYEFSDRLLIPLHQSTIPIDCPLDSASPMYSKLCSNGKSDEVIVQGLYVRHGRSPEAGLIFGGLLPIALIFVAGFISLSGRRRG